MRLRLPARRSSGAPHPAFWGLLVLVTVVPACGDVEPEGDVDTAAAPGAETAPGEPPAIDMAQVGIDSGDPESAVAAVIEFGDFGCVHCAEFHNETYPALAEEFVETGDIFWKYVPISNAGFPNGRLAAFAGVCASDQGLFPGVRDRIFETRESWMAAEEGEARDMFISYLEVLRGDVGDFEDCLESDAAVERIEENNEIAGQVGIRVTPTFLIQGQGVQGAPALDEFRDALSQLIEQIRAAEAGAASGSGAPEAEATP